MESITHNQFPTGKIPPKNIMCLWISMLHVILRSKDSKQQTLFKSQDKYTEFRNRKYYKQKPYSNSLLYLSARFSNHKKKILTILNNI